MARTGWTRAWTMTPRECGARTLSRASRRLWQSTPPAAGGRSSSRMKARCTVSAHIGWVGHCVCHCALGWGWFRAQSPCGIRPRAPQLQNRFPELCGVGYQRAVTRVPMVLSQPSPPSCSRCAGPTGLVEPWGREWAWLCLTALPVVS